MADLVLAPIVSATVSKVTALASEQLNLALGWRQDLERFCNKMEMVGGVLQDADERHVAGNSELKAWLKGLRDVADEADDVFEEIHYENLRRQVADLKKSKWKKVSYFFTLSNPLVFRLRMANRVKNLNAYLDDINDSASRLGLQNKLGNPSAPEPRVNRQTHSFPDQKVVGRNEDVDQIVSLLTDSSNQEALSVISIVGMAGLGKTTLAKAVRAEDKIREYFGENIMWVCVSEIFDVQGILGEMLESLTGTPCINKNRDTLVRKIGEELEKKGEEKREERKEGKNYLLILDDVWSEESGNWDELRSCLLGICRKSGNRVVATTRNRNVASVMGSKYTHVLKQLEADQCWSIIKQRAFGDGAMPSKLEEIGMDIAKKCGGVPLVADVVGGTLHNKGDEKEWLSVKDKINVWGSLEDQHNRIMDVLQLSFERLPKPVLKQCFAFCSIFPKDFVIVKEKLIELWMAEGFLQSSEESSMEGMGDKYFNSLLLYSLFQREARAFGSVRSCKIHDLIHDFAQSIYAEAVIIYERSSCNIPRHVRHLNLSFGQEKLQVKLEGDAEKLQTLFSKQGFPTSLRGNFKKLRVLSVCDADDVESLPSCFGNLKSLRYLDISGTPIRQLPKFITKMYNLQTFRFTNCKFLKMPLEGIGHLINLRHIYFNDEDRMPAHISRLTSLQTLQKFFVGEKRGRKIEELGKLSQLRGGLEIYNLECVKDKSEAQKARLKEKALDRLQLIWEDEGNPDKDEDVLEGLQPPSNLQMLKIQGYRGENLPPWMLESNGELFLLKNLVELDIRRCRKLKSIPLLKGFSSLRQLRISECSELSRIDDGAFEFTSLEELFIFRCAKLESVIVSGLTSLQTVVIFSCELLSSIGDSLSTSKCLKRLLLVSCKNLESVPSLEGLTCLKEVRISQCYRLNYLPSGLSSCTALEELSIFNCRNLVSIIEELKELRSLVTLKISWCQKLMSFPKESLGCLNRLKSLSIGGFSDDMAEFPDLSSINASLEELSLLNWRTSQWPHQIQRFTALKELSIEGFRNEVEGLSDGLEKLSSLTTLRIKRCDGLISLPQGLSDGLEKLSSLTTLRIDGCDDLISLPQGLNKLPHLRTLEILLCPNLTSLSEDLKELRSLFQLSVRYCRKLRSFPGGCLTSLKRLEIGGFSEELVEFPGLSSIHDDLEELKLVGWDRLTQLPHQIQHLTALKKLSISSFKQVGDLPEWVGNFSSLQSLQINFCDTMKQLPSAEAIRRLSKLQELSIWDCPELKERCHKKRGSEWSKISHIPQIDIP